MRGLRNWPMMVAMMLLAGASAAGFALEAEWLWGTSLGLLLFAFTMLPSLTMRQRHLSRIEKGEELARWRYSYNESRRIAGELLAQGAKRRRAFGILMSVCLGIMTLIFADVICNENPSVPMWQALLLLIIAAFPWLGIVIYKAFLKRLVQRNPCETVIGRDFLLLANTRPVFNEREGLKATEAHVVSEGGGLLYLQVLYRSIGRMRYGGKINYKDTVKIPVPLELEEEAKRVADAINGGKKGKV